MELEIQESFKEEEEEEEEGSRRGRKSWKGYTKLKVQRARIKIKHSLMLV